MLVSISEQQEKNPNYDFNRGLYFNTREDSPYRDNYFIGVTVIMFIIWCAQEEEENGTYFI